MGHPGLRADRMAFCFVSIRTPKSRNGSETSGSRIPWPGARTSVASTSGTRSPILFGSMTTIWPRVRSRTNDRFWRASREACPDGSTVDSAGYLWNCRFFGGCIVRVAPDGQIDRVVEMPAKNITTCTFGGPDRKTLYVTIASIQAPNTHSIFCDGPHGPETVNGCPVLRRKEPPPRGTRARLRVPTGSTVRAPPKRASGESFSPLTKTYMEVGNSDCDLKAVGMIV